MSAHTTKNTTSGKATWSFYGDDDTGIDSDAANQIDLMTGGTVRAKVTSSGLSVDTINEYTSGSGVTADGVLLKDGGVSLTGALAQSSGSYRTPQVYKASIVSSIAGATTAGGVFKFANPASSASTSVMILKVNVNLGTACSSAAGTIDIGTASASNASADNLIDGLALSTAGFFDNVASSGTNGTTVGRILTSGAWITGTVKTGNISDAVGDVYVTYVPV